MKYLESFEQVTNRHYNEKLIGHSRSIQLGYRRGRRALLVFYLLAIADSNVRVIQKLLQDAFLLVGRARMAFEDKPVFLCDSEVVK